jgi:hypothetical protein
MKKTSALAGVEHEQEARKDKRCDQPSLRIGFGSVRFEQAHLMSWLVKPMKSVALSILESRAE